MTLSVVELPPKVPQPRVSDGVRPLPTPMHPWVAGPLTRMRLAGTSSANRCWSDWSPVWITAV